eukprot:7410901-Alexandrium_andersonii.AAC.1
MVGGAPQCGRGAVVNLPPLQWPSPYHARRGASARLPTDESDTVPPQHRAMVVVPGPLTPWSTTQRGPGRR